MKRFITLICLLSLGFMTSPAQDLTTPQAVLEAHFAKTNIKKFESFNSYQITNAGITKMPEMMGGGTADATSVITYKTPAYVASETVVISDQGISETLFVVTPEDAWTKVDGELMTEEIPNTAGESLPTHALKLLENTTLDLSEDTFDDHAVYAVSYEDSSASTMFGPDGSSHNTMYIDKETLMLIGTKSVIQQQVQGMDLEATNLSRFNGYKDVGHGIMLAGTTTTEMLIKVIGMEMNMNTELSFKSIDFDIEVDETLFQKN